MTKNKRVEAVNIKIDTNMDADDYGHRISECVSRLSPDIDVVNLVKVDFGNSHVPVDKVGNFMKNLKEMFIEVDARNCMLVAIGKHMGIQDIKIDHLEVVNNESDK